MTAVVTTRSPRRDVLFWIGISIYAGSFLLVDVVGNGPGRGYVSAWVSLVLPWSGNPFGHQGIFENKPAEYFALLLSGWINPVFLLTLFCIRRKRPRRLINILRMAILLMIPCCWVVFHHEGFYPREGHFLWILGMLLVLFANEASELSIANATEQASSRRQADHELPPLNPA
jgi:peptidoglycan/LPS O-acetylase OafA/YrhL